MASLTTLPSWRQNFQTPNSMQMSLMPERVVCNKDFQPTDQTSHPKTLASLSSPQHIKCAIFTATFQRPLNPLCQTLLALQIEIYLSLSVICHTEVSKTRTQFRHSLQSLQIPSEICAQTSYYLTDGKLQSQQTKQTLAQLQSCNFGSFSIKEEQFRITAS